MRATPNHPARHRLARRNVGLLAASLLVAAGSRVVVANAQTAPAATPAVSDSPAGRLPFWAGERLTYRVVVPKIGTVGRGSMTVEGPVDVRGVDAVQLRSEFKVRMGILRATNSSESWLDTRRMAALRFHKHERQPLSGDDERVELFPEERRWQADDGTAGQSLTSAPLDELSFMYFIRTLALAPDSTYRFDRHFDPARNPTTVRLVGHDTLTTAAGTFPTLVVEMRVRDARRYRGEGTIRIYLTDDHCRIPVRIESSMPIVGRTVLVLESQNHPSGHFAAREP